GVSSAIRISRPLMPEADAGSLVAKVCIGLRLRSRSRDRYAVAWHAARVQCSRGFRLFPFRGPCDAFVTASLFSRVAARELSQFAYRVRDSTRVNPTTMYKLYSMQRSGNSYKVRLALALLNAPYRSEEH